MIKYYTTHCYANIFFLWPANYTEVLFDTDFSFITFSTCSFFSNQSYDGTTTHAVRHTVAEKLLNHSLNHLKEIPYQFDGPDRRL